MTDKTDHQRGCAGRDYTCTCGYDDAVNNRLEALYSRMMQFRGANHALRLGLYGLIDSDDADTIATTLEAGREVDCSEYPQTTLAALEASGLEIREKSK